RVPRGPSTPTAPPRPPPRPPTPEKLIRPENVKALALSSHRLAAVEGDELEGAGLVLGGDQGGADVEGVGGPHRVAAHDALGVTPDDVGRRHLGPALPRIQAKASHQTELTGPHCVGEAAA